MGDHRPSFDEQVRAFIRPVDDAFYQDDAIDRVELECPPTAAALLALSRTTMHSRAEIATAFGWLRKYRSGLRPMEAAAVIERAASVCVGERNLSLEAGVHEVLRMADQLKKARTGADREGDGDGE